MPHEGSVPGVSRRGGRRKGSGKRADASAPWPLRAVQALADGSRWSIIQYLSTNEAAIGQVARELGLSVACTSKHMSILKESELVQTARRGREVVCRLAIAGTPAGDLLEAVGVSGLKRGGDTVAPASAQARSSSPAPELDDLLRPNIIRYQSKDMDDYLL